MEQENTKEFEFPILNDETYLDHAGCTLYAKSQIDAVHHDLISHLYGNPHSNSPSSQLTTDLIEQQRERILQFFGTNSSQYSVVFTSGCTGALKLLAESFDFHADFEHDAGEHSSENHRKGVINENRHKHLSKFDDKNVFTAIQKTKSEKNEIELQCYTNTTTDADSIETVTLPLDIKSNLNYKHDSATNIILCTNYDTDFKSLKTEKAVQTIFSTDNQSCNKQNCDKDYCDTESKNFNEEQTCKVDNLVNKRNCDIKVIKPRTKNKPRSKSGIFSNGFSIKPKESLTHKKDCEIKVIEPNSKTESESKTSQEYINSEHEHHLQDNLSYKFEESSDSHENLCPRVKCGCFCYLQDNHTSVYGMREVMGERGAYVVCVEEDVVGTSDTRSRYTIYGGNCLFAYPAQSNFSGRKYPLSWIESVKNGLLNNVVKGGNRWFTLLDAASFVSTSRLDLNRFKPDFVTLSFYKMFGYPTGLGALLVKKSAESVLKRRYFGGGTISVSSARERFHVYKNDFSQRFEDGTLPFLDIISLRHGFDALERIGGVISAISQHTFSIAKHFYQQLTSLHHGNRSPVATVYCDTHFDDISTQGAIVNFNITQADGSFVGYSTVEKLAAAHNIHLRTGCFCNIGSCQKFLGITSEQIRSNYNAGHVCGDDLDLINGSPTGSIRVSFGYMSTLEDADVCVKFIRECFVQGCETINQICEHPLQMSTCGERYLTDICLYPIKSCAAYSVSSWRVGERGLLYDRHWMIVDGAGVRVTLKNQPKLCFVRPEVDLDNHMLCLHYPGVSSLVLPIDEHGDEVSGNLCTARVCGKSISLVDCGKRASDWLSRCLNQPNIRLVHQKSCDHRRSKTHATLSLANLGQFLVLNRASVTCLRERISGRQHLDISDDRLLLRFRGNLVLSGGEAFDEEMWEGVQIGDLTLQMQGRCSRCNMICVNTDDGTNSKEPLATLAAWPQRKMQFGVYMSHTQKDGETRDIRVGMPVTPLMI